MALAFLAVALKVAIPAGYMVAGPTNDSPFAIVLCTDQGRVLVQPGEALSTTGQHDKAPGDGQGGDGHCLFAGHAAAAPPPSSAAAAPARFVAYEAYLPSAKPSVSPGRGISGPPLPARGPPSDLI